MDIVLASREEKTAVIIENKIWSGESSHQLNDYLEKSNLFNLDSLYRKMPIKSFIKGRKQEFEILFMYYWIHDMEGDNDYWQEYLETVLLAFKKE